MQFYNRIVLTTLGFALLCMLLWIGYRLVPESSPVALGAAYANGRGCINCHGKPSNPMADANDTTCTNTNEINDHPDYNVVCTDVMAYFESVRLLRLSKAQREIHSQSPLAAGEHLARKYHCFQCHGQLGQGGFKNTGSLKGYVPGYFGADFRTLTNNADPASVREWILHGVDSAIVEKPLTGAIAAFFFDNQAVHMPSYKTLQAEEVDVLVNYLLALQTIGPMTAQDIRLYSLQVHAAQNFATLRNDVENLPPEIEISKTLTFKNSAAIHVQEK